MRQLYLTKEFRELDGLDLVVVHWTVTREGADPDWSTAHSLAMLAVKRDGGWNRNRQGVLGVELPGEPPWTLHHFFDWIRYGVFQSGPAYREEIVARPIEYLDDSGEFTHATLVYNVGEGDWTNIAAMKLEGAPEDRPPAPEWPEPEGRSFAWRKLRARAEAMALPLKFTGKLIAPAGNKVSYSIHLSRRNGLNPMADRGRWVFRQEIMV